MSESYHEQVDDQNQLYINEICAELPPFVDDFFIGISMNRASRTRLGYARDLKNFFFYIVDNIDDVEFKNNKHYDVSSVKDISLELLSDITSSAIERYLYRIRIYKKNGRTVKNGEASMKRKLSSLSVFYNYFYKNDKVTDNPVSKIDRPKLHEKQIVRMDAAETANFLDTVEYGTNLTAHQQKFHEKNKTRDLALLTLMLSTGIRISECVGLNVNDIDIENTCIRVVRKGGKEAIVYFSDEAIEPIQEYLAERKKIEPLKGHEDALFLSSQRKRLGVRSIENLVKKYAASSVPLKHITPHKLRSTFGTALYKETDDIYLVASVLGHTDVNTTRKHYADLDTDTKRAARNKVSLREKPEKDT